MDESKVAVDEVAAAVGADCWNGAWINLNALLMRAEELGDAELGDLRVADVLRRLRDGEPGRPLERSRADLEFLRGWLRGDEI